MHQNVRCPRSPGRLGRLVFILALLFSAAVQAAAPGAPLGPEFSVNEAGTAAREYPAVARNGSGDTVVAWVVDGVASRKSPVPSEIRARRLAADGSPRGPEFLVDTLTPFGAPSSYFPLFRNRPAVAIDAAGAFVVAWTDSGVPNTVRARRYGADGNPLAAAVEVEAAGNGGDILATTVAMNDSGAFVVAWSEYPNPIRLDACCTALEHGSFRARRYSAGGTVAERTIIVEADLTLRINNPISSLFFGPMPASFSAAVGMAGDGSFALAWSHYGAVGLTSGVYTRWDPLESTCRHASLSIL